MLRAVAALLPIALAGCTLVDQRSFQPAGQAPQVVAVVEGVPVATVRLGGAEFRAVLAEAVQAAQQRAPAQGFDVLALVPAADGPAAQERVVAAAARDAREVAEAMSAAGVPAARVRLGLRSDPGAPLRMVQVFAR
jgi:hypothetical protein